MNSTALVEQKYGDFWDLCLDSLREIFGENVYLTWIETLRFLGIQNKQVDLGVMHQLHQDWLERYYHDDILKVVREQIGMDAQVKYCAITDSRPVPALKLDKDTRIVSLQAPQPSPKIRLISRPIPVELLPRHTFASFIVGDCNRMAYTVATTVAEHPGVNQFNPLVLYGQSGIGKTHLLQAIARNALENQTASKVVYRTSDQFLKDFMSAVQSRRFMDFNRIYEDADLLIIDDIQFLAGKDGTQEALFKLFTRTLSHNQQVVLSCDQPPAQVERLDRRLLSRFDSGLCCSINALDMDTRLGILRAKAKSQGMELSNESLSWLATHFQSSVRELEGTLVKLVGLRDLMGIEPTLDTIRQIMGDVVRNHAQAIQMSKVRDVVSISYGIKSSLLSSATRIQGISIPRKVAMYLCRELTDQSLQSIGLEFQRDYSTVIASIKSVSRQMEEDADFRNRVESIRLQLLS